MFASCPVQLTKWLACEKGMQWCQAFEALVCMACYCYLVRLLLSSRTRHGCSTVAGALLALAQQAHPPAEMRNISWFTTLRPVAKGLGPPGPAPERAKRGTSLLTRTSCNETQRLQETPGGGKDVPVRKEEQRETGNSTNDLKCSEWLCVTLSPFERHIRQGCLKCPQQGWSTTLATRGREQARAVSRKPRAAQLSLHRLD